MNDDLPSLERARSMGADLPAGEPTDARKVAAIVFVARVLRRESWDEEVELAPELFARYPTTTPAVPGDFLDAGYQLVDMSRPVTRGKCRSCFLSPGTILCTRCFGQKGDEAICAYCNGEPVKCTACDGSGETVRATLRHVNDKAVAHERTFHPELPETLAAEIVAIVDAVRAPPESRRFALQANVVESAYRGASALRAPEYRGHTFGDALAGALDAERDLDRYSNVVARDVRAYAWPILVVRFADAPFALLDDAEGVLRVVGVDSSAGRRTT